MKKRVTTFLWYLKKLREQRDKLLAEQASIYKTYRKESDKWAETYFDPSPWVKRWSKPDLDHNCIDQLNKEIKKVCSLISEMSFLDWDKRKWYYKDHS